MFSISKATVFVSLALGFGLAHAAPAATHVGDASWYIPGGFSACGVVDSPTDFVAGVSAEIFADFGGGNPNNNPVCGRNIVANTRDGKSVTVKVAEQCGHCTRDDILLSHSAFSTLANPTVGIIQDVNWVIV